MEERQSVFWNRVTVIFPLLIAVFAAILSVNDLMLSKYGVKMDALFSLRDRQLQWYHAKGIKSTQLETQLRFFKALVGAGIVDKAGTDKLQNLAEELTREVSRYEKDRKEILLGSNTVGEANWSQDVNGVLGKIAGVNETQALIDGYKPTRELFMNASMLLRICLALGAVGVMITQTSNKIIFFTLTTLSGLVGTIYFVLAAIAMMPMQ